MRFSLYFILLCFFTLTSCQLFEASKEDRIVAKVHNVNLYEDDLKDFNIPYGLSEKDSISILIEKINSWATKQLILHEAKKNMTEKKQRENNNLVEQYKLDLFTSAYENAYVKKNLKTGISKNEIEVYYNKYKSSFSLQEAIVIVRYIELDKKYKDLYVTKKAFKRFNEEDISELSKIKLSFTRTNFNLKKQWTPFNTLLEDIPSLKYYKTDQLLTGNKFLSYKTEESRFLVMISEALKAGEIAPLTHVEKRIKQIILNKRKLQLKKQLEQEIRKDALQTKEFQIFE